MVLFLKFSVFFNISCFYIHCHIYFITLPKRSGGFWLKCTEMRRSARLFCNTVGKPDASLITCVPSQSLPAAALLSGRADQQQAFPQDRPPAVVSDAVALVREAGLAPHLPEPPQTAAAQSVMDPCKARTISTNVWHQSVSIPPEGLTSKKTTCNAK